MKEYKPLKPLITCLCIYVIRIIYTYINNASNKRININKNIKTVSKLI